MITAARPAGARPTITETGSYRKAGMHALTQLPDDSFWVDVQRERAGTFQPAGSYSANDSSSNFSEASESN